MKTGGVPLFVAAFFCAAFLASCTASRETAPDEASSGKQVGRQSKAPLSVYEATLNPSDFDEDVNIVRKTHAEVDTTLPLTIPTDSTVVEEEIVQGFRIQIYTSPNIDDANAARLVAAKEFPADSVYVVYDPPVYKVRIGDFTNRLEASRKLSDVISSQYPDAWLVTDKIVHRKLVRVPVAPKR
jgi:hypothetical protein